MREKNKARTRTAILTAAKELAKQGQWDAVTTRQIADAAGVSYQTLYNYYPSKASILVEMLLEVYVGPGPAISDAVKHYDGDLLGTLDEINQLRFQSFGRDDVKWILTITASLTMPDQSSEATNLIETIDHAGDGYYYSALSMAKGMGHLQDDVDIQLMAHTLSGITSATLSRFILNNANAQAQIQTLRQQIEQLVRPYLIG
ncbi:MAG: TetR/AcrR family transcriptional regulator [Candidatus Azotimanducaceae bacterium]